MSQRHKTLTVEEAIKELRAMDANIIHGSDVFAQIADMLENKPQQAELLVTVVVNGIPSDERHGGKSILRNVTDQAIKKRGYETGDQWEVKDAGGHLLAEDCELRDVWQQIVYASKAYHRGPQTLLFVTLKAGTGA